MKTNTRFIFFFFYTPIVACSVFSNSELSSLISIRSTFIHTPASLKDWNISTDYCDWAGVLCNSDGSVITLDLSNANITGSLSESIRGLTNLSDLNLSCNTLSSKLPSSLSSLTSLKTIDVSQNNFLGRFPAGLGDLPELVSINASGNSFLGPLPEDLGRSFSLEVLDLRGSFFQGPIPESFKNLQTLRFLGLSGNNLTGEIPAGLGELPNLEVMILGYNQFNGPIPASFGNLRNLGYLDLAYGNLSGEIPAALGAMNNLITMYLYQNKFDGKIPPEIGSIASLVSLDLSDNRISGEIPKELAELKNIELLNLMCNDLSGPIPEKLGELKNLKVLQLWKNSLTGSLPMSLGKNSPLQWLDVSTNSLSGKIPPGLCSYGNFTKLILFNNSFTGPIPAELSNCSSLIRVRIQRNSFSGSIPLGLGTLPNLNWLELGSNNISGEIPQDFALSGSLSFIDISKNRLSSSLPAGILSISTLQMFVSSGNNLQGNILDQFYDCYSLTLLDLSHNRFSGIIPRSIASCEKMVTLNLGSNLFSGEIPRAVANMPTLSVLDLSNNTLVGKIPENFGSSPALETLNLSYNKLSGPIPNNGILRTISQNSVIGNSGLCGAVLQPCFQSITTTDRPRKHSKRQILLGLLVGISVILAAGILVFTGKQAYEKWYLCIDCSFTDWFRKNNSEYPWRLVGYQRLHFTSSDILSCLKDSNIIGAGGTGIVYKAEIQKPRSIVAVKKLWRSPGDVETGDELFAEVDLLSKLRHRNIVRVLGYLHNEIDLMMVYEYMPNGSLGSALHGKEAGKMLLDWVSRYNVGLGMAHGLAYLHHDCHPPVIHRDVKSNNILLDENFEARIADFGLARTMKCKNETVSMVAGSYGYIAPEYGYTLKVDEKTDIYSFGVVLLELITGKTPLDPSFGESVDIVEWVRRKESGEFSVEESILDPDIAGECKLVQEEMVLVFKIAVLCTSKLPKERPSMRDVVTMLGEANPRRKSVCERRGYSKEQLIFAHSPVIGLL